MAEQENHHGWAPDVAGDDPTAAEGFQDLLRFRMAFFQILAEQLFARTGQRALLNEKQGALQANAF